MASSDPGGRRRSYRRPGPSATVASTSTSGPTFSTQGARMNTAWNGRGRTPRSRRRPRTSRPAGRTRCGAPSTSRPPKVCWPSMPPLDPVGQHDHPGAGAERRHPVARSASRSGSNRSKVARQLVHRRRLPARQDQRVDGSRARRPCGRGRGRVPSAASTATCSRTSPCSESTPTTGRLTGEATAPGRRHAGATRRRSRSGPRRSARPGRAWPGCRRRGRAADHLARRWRCLRATR